MTRREGDVVTNRHRMSKLTSYALKLILLGLILLLGWIVVLGMIIAQMPPMPIAP
jgi:hypothetical protein